MAEFGIQKAESVRTVKTRLVIIHLSCLGVFFLPTTPSLLIAAVLSYLLHVFAYEGIVHRYFSHRSFKTSRTFQFILGAFASACGMRGPIWWAAHHRDHHRFSDKDGDRHSPVVFSFWHAFIGWYMVENALDTDLDKARDLAKYPELVWLNRYYAVFLLIGLLATYALGQFTTLLGEPSVGLGLSAVVWLFVIPMLLAIYSASLVNTFAHGVKPGLFNSRRYETGDTTTNIWALAILTMGASWHNNHHRHMNAARAGFFWWEIDMTYMVLKAMAAVGLVWDLQPVTEQILDEGRKADLAAKTAA